MSSVLLLEAGAPDDNPAIHDPARLFELWDSEQDWGYRTVPQAGVRRPRAALAARQGARRLERAERDDLRARRSQRLRHAGRTSAIAGWGYDDVLPLFKRSEDFDRGADAYHGSGGPLQ